MQNSKLLIEPLRLRNLITFVLFSLFSFQVFAIGNTETKKGDLAIESKILKVTLDESFPRIIQYNWISNGNVIYGQEDKLSQVKINGVLYTPATTSTKTKNSVDYSLNIPEIDVTIKIRIKVTSVKLNII